MYASELFENGKPRIVVTYPGRFQPFHKGHAEVFKKLQKEFGNENVFVITSNDTSSAKNPFSFGDKYQLITTAGVPAHSIMETNKMYSLPDDFDSSNTIFVTAVGSPDADRLRPDSFLKKDRKDKEGNIIKRAGDPGYYKLWSSPEDKVTADQHGYVVIVPEIKSAITIVDETHDASHGTECRRLWNKVRKNPTHRNEFLKALYGKATPELVHIFEKIAEDVLPDSSDSTSPIHGAPVKTLEQDLNEHDDIAKGVFVFEDAAGVGVVATNKKMARDPRYSMSITQDVKTTTPKKQLRAFRLTAENMDHSKDDRAVPELKAALLAHKNKIASASEDKVYDIIDKLMTRIAKSHGISGQKLHDMWVDKYKQIPDTWIMKVDDLTEDDRFEIKNFEKLDNILLKLCNLVINSAKIDKHPGLVAACVLDPDNRLVAETSSFDGSKWHHAERNAIEAYYEEYGDIPDGSIIVTTLSPCCQPMDDRFDESCEDVISQTNVHKVYCGYDDPTQTEHGNKLFHTMVTRNKNVQDLCKSFADIFLNKNVNEDVQMSKPASEPDMPAMLAQLLPIAMRVLKINVLPKIILQKHLEAHDGQPSFGRFVNHECTIYLGIADRHPNDIFRTLAHELTHFKQYLNHELNHKSGETGSPEENEAHATAGVVMREYNKAHPDNLLSNPLNVD